MISGFVISYTLTHTANLLSFYRNRFSRLFPAMLLCTVLTFVLIHLLDKQHQFKNAHAFKNFVPSLTFVNPNIWSLITAIDFHWINGSYWSLWVEVQFYTIASGIYFFHKKYFFRNLLVIGVLVSLVKFVPVYLLNYHSDYLQSHGLNLYFTGWRTANELFNITFYITWFLLGAVFHQLYQGFNFKHNLTLLPLLAVTLLCLAEETWVFFAASFGMTMITCVLMCILFMLMIYKKRYLFFMENTLMYRVGIISYSLYLIHEQIGILLINKYGNYLGNWAGLSPFIIIILATCFAELSYQFYETKVAMLLKKHTTSTPVLDNCPCDTEVEVD